MRIVVALLGLIGCGNVNSSAGGAVDAAEPTPDAPAPSADAPGDAAPACDPTRPFAAPTVVRGLESAAGSVARLSLDERTMYLNGFDGSQTDLLVTRQAASGAFELPRPLASPPNTPTSEYDPALSTDGLTLLFSSARGDGPLSQSLYIATRTASGDFDNARLATLDPADTGADQLPYVMGQPYLPATGHEVWFISNRADGKGMADLWHATLTGGAIGVQHPATELNSPASELFPTVSADGLTIYFASTRPAPGTTAARSYDLWTSHRTSTSGDFPAPTLVDELNTATEDYPGWLSPDNCRLYFVSNRGQGFRTYVATRQP